jgi:alkylhydroperoxidase family enzyme
MAYIKLIEESEATGVLAEIYEQARQRAGRVYNILKIQSQTPEALRGMLQIYKAAVRGESPLSLAQREMLATVVSSANKCHY